MNEPPTIPLMKPWVGDEEAGAAADAVRSGWLAQGPRVAAFEAALAARLQAEHGVAVSSGTTALQLGLLLAGIGPGDEVVVPSLSYIATAAVVLHVGATPVFADVDPTTLNVTAETVSAVVAPRCRAVIPVHQAGMPLDLDPIHAACRERGIDVLEDAACAIGATSKGRPVGSHSDLVAVSFHPRKVITTGEGGMLLLSGERADERLERARRLREHGVSVSAWSRHRGTTVTREEYPEIGFNFRMSDPQAAIGSVQLGRLDEIVRRRRRLAARYHELLADVPGVSMPHDPAWGETNYQSFWVVLADDFPARRDEVLGAMAQAGIACRRGIMAAHLERAFRHLPPARLPITERLTAQSLILPMFHEMSDRDQCAVARVLRRMAGLAPV